VVDCDQLRFGINRRNGIVRQNNVRHPAPVIPSEVEGSRVGTSRSRNGILRLRFAALRMTALFVR
jgi:hypothetical protein